MYPPDRAFVVQFSGDTDPGIERMIGRVEHLESGRRCLFDSPEQLVEFMKKVLTPPEVASHATAQECGNSNGDVEDENV